MGQLADPHPLLTSPQAAQEGRQAEPEGTSTAAAGPGPGGPAWRAPQTPCPRLEGDLGPRLLRPPWFWGWMMGVLGARPRGKQ